MKRTVMSLTVVGGLLLSFVLLGTIIGRAQSDSLDQAQVQSDSTDASRIKEGFRIAPVKLNLKGRNRALVGIGSYLVNAVSECSDCHTRPHFLPGGNPFNGEPEVINSPQYLTGGNQFGPFTSANLTPDAAGLPAGLTFEEFLHLMRTGETDDHPAFGPLLQVMPWPTFRKMTNWDLRAIYEFLSAIPSRPDNPNPGECCPED
jgi:hypothetical protein